MNYHRVGTSIYQGIREEYDYLVRRYRSGYIDPMVYFGLTSEAIIGGGRNVYHEYVGPMFDADWYSGSVSLVGEAYCVDITRVVLTKVQDTGLPQQMCTMAPFPYPHGAMSYLAEYLRVAAVVCPAKGDIGIVVATGFASFHTYVEYGVCRSKLYTYMSHQMRSAQMDFRENATNLVIEWDHYETTGLVHRKE